MGADGGVCWVKTFDRKRFFELANPFGFLYFDDYRSVNDEWAVANAEEDHYYATYGSFQDICMGTMIEVLETIEYLTEDPPEAYSYGMQGVHKLTFYEAYLNKLTQPAKDPWAYWSLDKTLHNLEYDFGKNGEKEPEPGSIYNMTLEDWAEEIRKTFDLSSYGCELTWT